MDTCSNPTTVNGSLFRVKCIPEVLTKPVTVGVGEDTVDVVDVPVPEEVEVEVTLEVPGMHCE